MQKLQEPALAAPMVSLRIAKPPKNILLPPKREAFVIGGFAIACTELIGVQSSSVQGALFSAIVSPSGLGLTTANSLAQCRMTLIPKQAVGLVTGIQRVSTSLEGTGGPILSVWGTLDAFDARAGLAASRNCVLVSSGIPRTLSSHSMD